MKAVPKRETAKIQVAPTAPTTGKATVRMQNAPAPTTAGPTRVATAAAAEAAPDPLVVPLTWAVFLLSLASAAAAFLAYNS
jgi:hypothetical protein